MKKSTLLFAFLLPFIVTETFAQGKKLSVLGSSTAAGVGPASIDSSWVNRLNYEYKTVMGILDSTNNLAVSGTTPYNAMPDGYTPPAGRPAYDATKNVSRAISFFSGLSTPSNGVVIVNFPTNGFDGYSISEIMTCFQTIYDQAVSAGHKCYITTTQPRSDAAFSTSAAKRKLADIKDSIIARFGITYTINFYDGIYNPADSSILSAYSAGDNVHLNNAGHRILFDRIVAKNIFGLGTNEYRTNVNPAGLWSSASSWQVFNGSAWVTASAAPDSTSGNIHILDGDSITVSAATTMDQVMIHISGKLAIYNTGSSFTATLNNGAGTDLEVNGRLYISVNATVNGTGTIVNNSSGLFILRNQGILQTAAINNGTVNVSGTGNIRSTTFTNNKTFVLIDFTLNINNSTFVNNDSFAILYNATSYISTTIVSDSGIFQNELNGIIHRTNTSGSTTFSSQVKLYNYGTMKGYGEYIVYNPTVNTGIIDPGNYSAGILTVNPAFITGKSPTFLLQVHSTGGTAGTHYDQIRFSTINSLTTSISSTKLQFIDNASDANGTIYTLVSISGLQVITGTFPTTYLPGNFGNPSYNLLSITIQKSAAGRIWDGGAGSTNWGDAANWNPDGVPSATENAVIPTGTSVNINVNATCKDLTLNSTGLSVMLQTGYSLTINGALTAQLGNININGQSLVLNGTMVPQGSGGISGTSASSLTIGGSSGGNFGTLKLNVSPYNALQNLTINRSGASGSVTLGSNGIQLGGTLTLSNGTLNTGGNLTLLSTAGGTALIAAVTNGNISGDITVQRYIPGGADHRRFRFLASPVENVTLFNSWQQNIHITGAGTGGSLCPSMTQHSNGFDASSTNAASIYTYSEVTNTWGSVANTNATNLQVGTGYRVFVRGNRADGCALLTTMPTTTSNVTLSAKGTIVTGTRNVSLIRTGNNGWNLVGNPYASAIDWSNPTWQSAMSSSIGRTIYVFNPVTNSYASWHPVAGAINGGSSIIASGQAFFVTVTGAATLQIEETYKSTETTGGIFGKNGGHEKLKIQLADSVIRDEMIAYTYTGASKNFDNMLDGKKADYATNRIASFTTADSTRLAFNAFSSDTSTSAVDTLPLATGLSANSTYALHFIGITSFGKTVVLYDKYAMAALTLSQDTNYTFTTTSDPLSINANRFYIVFVNTGTSTMPVKLAFFKGKEQDKKVLLQWATSSEQNNDYFSIERSTDNIEYTVIGKVYSTVHNSSKHLVYSFTDEAPIQGKTNYYRLGQTDFDQRSEYSPIVTVEFGNMVESGISVYPNPSAGYNPVQIMLGTMRKQVSLKLYTPEGVEIMRKHFTTVDNIILDKEFSYCKPGVYYIEIITDTTNQTLKVIKE